jgi:RNA polymerase sigma factor (sigma-70 family)
MAANPFTSDAGDREDGELIRSIQAGSQDALEALIRRHQGWIYNLARRMVYYGNEAEDVTQEILIKVITKISTFDGRSSVRTWLYRIVVNHILNMKRARGELAEWTFERYANELARTPDEDLPDQRSMPVDVQLLVDEARMSCTAGVLLCLDREQRLVFILGEVFGVPDTVGGELLDTTRENFRQKLSRARRDLYSFLQNKCGLVNTANPCRCAKKTRTFMRFGFVDPNNLLFAQSHVTRMKDLAGQTYEQLDALDASYAALQREHPFHDSPDFIASVRALIAQPDLQSILKGPKP